MYICTAPEVAMTETERRETVRMPSVCSIVRTMLAEDIAGVLN
jgi:hypothetical protein